MGWTRHSSWVVCWRYERADFKCSLTVRLVLICRLHSAVAVDARVTGLLQSILAPGRIGDDGLMCEYRGLFRILGEEVRRVVQEVVIAGGILLHRVEAITEERATLSVWLMGAIGCRRIHLDEEGAGHVDRIT